MAQALSMHGRKKLATLQAEFSAKFPYLTILFLDTRRRALDPDQTLAAVRTTKGKDLTIRGQMKVATFEARQSALTIGIRGIVPNDANQPAREQGVGVYIDGVYLGRAQGLGTALFDVENIEVLEAGYFQAEKVVAKSLAYGILSTLG